MYITVVSEQTEKIKDNQLQSVYTAYILCSLVKGWELLQTLQLSKKPCVYIFFRYDLMQERCPLMKKHNEPTQHCMVHQLN